MAYGKVELEAAFQIGHAWGLQCVCETLRSYGTGAELKEIADSLEAIAVERGGRALAQVPAPDRLGFISAVAAANTAANYEAKANLEK